MLLETITYSGNGSTQDVLGTLSSGTPIAVIIGRADVGTAYMKTADMATNTSHRLDRGTNSTSAITALIAGGFSLGSDVYANASGVTFTGVIIWDNGAGDVAHGTYAGNGTSQSISGIGFQPSIVTVIGDGWDWLPVAARTASMVGDVTMLGDNSADISGGITSLDATGFSVGAHNTVNHSGNNYWWLAFKTVAGWIEENDYTGNGADDSDKSLFTFQPTYVIVKGEGTTYGLIKNDKHTGETVNMIANNGSGSNMIQTLTADGIQTGSDSNANSNGVVYRVIGFKTGDSSTPPPLAAEAGDNKLDTGSGVTLDGSASGGTEPYSYSWTPTTGLSNPNIANPTAHPSTHTTYTLEVTDDDSNTATDTVKVYIQGLPINPVAQRATTDSASASATYIGDTFDMLDGPQQPISTWTAKNPNAKILYYSLIHMLNEVGDQSTEQITQLYYAWCEVNGVDYDDAFLHVAGAAVTVSQKADAYATYDSNLRYVLLNDSTSNLSDAMKGNTATATLDDADDSLYIGRLYRFDRITLTFSTPASADFAGTWEYWNGSAWTALTVTSDGTSDCTQNGTVVFTPPTAANWRRRQVNGVSSMWGAGVYWVRLRCSTDGTTPPVISGAKGRSYWQNNSGGTFDVPYWDAALDVDEDGYAETANGTTQALFRYESHLTDPWARCQFAADPGNTQYTAKAIEFIIAQMQAGESEGAVWYGTRHDNSNGDHNWSSGALTNGLLEYPGLTGATLSAAWKADMLTMLGDFKTALNAAGYKELGNTSFYGDADFALALDGCYCEDYPTSSGMRRPAYGSEAWGWEEALWDSEGMLQQCISAGKEIIAQWMQSGYYALEGDSFPNVTVVQGSDQVVGSGTHWLTTIEVGSMLYMNTSSVNYWAEVESIEDDTHCTLVTNWEGPNSTQSATFFIPREWKLALAFYLLLFDPSKAWLMLWWSTGWYYDPTLAPVFNYMAGLASADFGTPTGIVPAGKTARGSDGAFIMQTGADPSYGASTYYVYGRWYDNCLVLARPHSPSGAWDDTSAVTIDLDSEMTPLLLDGSQGAGVTSVSLRNGEAAVLFGGTPPVGALSLSKWW